jgi:Na+/proline symporter
MKRYERWALRGLVTVTFLLAFGLTVVAQMTGPERCWAILALTLSYGVLMVLIWLHERFPPPAAS